MDYNKQPKNKLKTLCTIDTSDIELHDLRRKSRKSCKKNHTPFNGRDQEEVYFRPNPKLGSKAITPKNIKQVSPSRSLKKFKQGHNKTISRSRNKT